MLATSTAAVVCCLVVALMYGLTLHPDQFTYIDNGAASRPPAINISDLERGFSR